ncbi:MAG: alpha/beta hydrolase [Clostridiales bacterium]|jgi:pimeloyl-ACP methyl ester carboxylesterase|nr:alpha/beta hydrolase [Clostridiales bacterium]
MFLEINGIRLYYEEYGDKNGDPVLFLHGNGGSVKTFERTKEAFTDKRVILMDSRGHGQSIFTGKIDFSMMADDTVGLLNALNIREISLVGYSDGGIIALEVAASMKDRVKKLVAIGANTRYNGMKAAFGIQLKAERLWFSALSFIPKYKKLKQLFDIMIYQTDITDESLSAITAKTLIVAGERDVIKESHTREIKDKIKDAELIIVKDADHFLFSRNNAKINGILKEFLRT